MAKTNKYASVNFNEIYAPKKPSSAGIAPPPSTSQPAVAISAARHHGRMLVLTRPSNPQPPPSPSAAPKLADPAPSRLEPDSISLRPLGRTDSSIFRAAAAGLPSGDKEDLDKLRERVPLKPEPFVPPHLRPGFAGREDKLGQERDQQGFRRRDRGFSQGREGDDERPKSGGYYEGMNRGGSEIDRTRPGSGGNRPGSSGGYGSFPRSSHC